MLPAHELSALPDLAIPEYARRGRGRKPTFFGHYWLTGAVEVQSPMAACVDYSAGKGGPLVAYRFDGEAELSEAKFVWVD